MSEIHPACAACKGACCEGLWLNDKTSEQYLRLHSNAESPAFGYHMPCRCTRLVDGLCSLWAERPALCQLYPVGGPACRETVRVLRDNDPEILKHL